MIRIRRLSLASLVSLVGVTATLLSPALAEDPAPAEDHAIEPGHNLLQESHTHAAAVGSQVGELSFRDLAGKSIYLTDRLESGPAVFVFLSTKCPLAKRYTQRLNRLHDEHASSGVSLIGVFPNSDETDASVRAHAQQCGFEFPVVRDIAGYVTNRLGATMTPQAFVLDRSGVIRYRGAIDDNRYENRVKHHYLADAVEQVIDGQDVTTSTAKSLGCSVHLADASQSDGEVTYSRHVARIIQDNCQSCHREGQVAPFALTNYSEAKNWATEIEAYTRSRLMPPWKAVRGFGEFKNDISLSAEEIDLITQWADQGAPLGNADEVPPSPRFNDGWAYGEPDLIVEMPEEYIVGPEGEDDYRHFIIPHEAVGHRFVEAVDVRPGNRNVVHHVLAYTDTSGKARELDAADEGPGYTRFGDVGFKPASLIGGWAPGNLPIRMPKGSGRWLPKACDIVLQVHYYRTGVEERDRTKLGLYFSKDPKPVPTRLGLAINKDFVIAAYDANSRAEATFTVEESSYLFAVTPHMHLIGETMEVTAHRPDGSVLPIVKIDDWDFNWQNSYHFRSLQHLPEGTEVRMVATFDNSAENPNNPNSPPKEIRWGDKTTDEMCIAFLGLLHESEYDPEKQQRRTSATELTSTQ